MDIFTQLTSGYLLKRIFSDKKTRFFLIIFLFSAVSPDIDIIWSWNNINLHRVLTHSLLLSPIFAFVLSFVFYFFNKKNKNITFRKIYLISLSWILAHIFLDYIAVWGIPILYPFSDKYYSLNLYMYVFDFFLFWVFAVVVLFIFLENKTKFVFSKMKVVFLSFLFCFIIFFRFLEWYYAGKISFLEDYIAVPYIKTGSDFLYLNRYKVIEKRGGFYNIEYVNVFSGNIFKIEKIKASEYQDICPKMHKWFLFEEGNLIWDIRYSDKLLDSGSCFYGVRFVR